MKTLYAIGEALIDFIPSSAETPLEAVEAFCPKVGGAPANVAAIYALLGGKSRMLTAVGKDAFGRKIQQTLAACGVDTAYIAEKSEANTALAFVGLDHKGDRSFSFYRSPSADMLYTESDLPTALQDAFALHFCSVALGDSPMKDAHRRAIALAKEAGALISFDVNLRFSLWESEDALYRAVWEFLPSADILKLSEEEIGFVTGTKDLEKAAKMLLTHCRYVIITRGKDGAMLFYTDKKNGMTTIAAPSIEVNTIDTTGAGDAFIGAFLSLLSSQTLPLDALDNGILSNLLLYANRIAAATTEYHGAIDSYQTVFSHL